MMNIFWDFHFVPTFTRTEGLDKFEWLVILMENVMMQFFWLGPNCEIPCVAVFLCECKKGKSMVVVVNANEAKYVFAFL